MTRRIVVVLLFSLMLALSLAARAGHAQGDRPGGPPQGAVQDGVYTNPQAGYSFRLPTAWLSYGYQWYEYWGAQADQRRPGTKFVADWVYTPVGAGQAEVRLLSINVYDKAYWDNLVSQPIALLDVPVAETADSVITAFFPKAAPYPEGSAEAMTYEAMVPTVEQVHQAVSAVGAPPRPPTSTPGAGNTGIANPASQNCVKQGGALVIETRPDGGQYGVCQFEDNRQCEEWALLRGECPIGGVTVTGYATPAGRYCAITGGQYAANSGRGSDDEQGTCTFKDGRQCDAQAYFEGACSPSSAVAPGRLLGHADGTTPLGTGLTNLTNNPADEQFPSWRP